MQAEHGELGHGSRPSFRGKPEKRMSTTTEQHDAVGSDRSERVRHETPHERLDRNMTELVGELRVALPGVQVLFAFLLVVPFNHRFGEVTAFQEKVYLVTLLSTAAATALLLAPSTLHRIQFRRDDKKHIVESANRYAIAGFSMLFVAITGAVLLVTDFVYSQATAVAATGGTAALMLVCWFVLPIRRRVRRGSVT